ncbi:Ig-like domain repeat protein [Streptomyces mirabilis]|uniref:TOTE conflict system archaeo-eukaryotic primase domain-containing protein n=1 Tax=Streptomyces mirabilis TaxID=68239 RepID=UPI00367D1D40
MDDWDGWDDPAELRIRLDVALEHIAELAEENRRLRERLGMPAPDTVAERPEAVERPAPPTLPEMPYGSGLPYADAASAPQAKVALFRALFVGRTDVYANRWVSAKNGRTGWSPAEENPWDKAKSEAERVFFPLTDEVIFRHLSRTEPGQRELHVGLYPMFPDDTTQLLACDFDGRDWQGDAAAYVAACTEAGVPALAEVSRSGSGAHVWIFFTAAVPASLARVLGMALLRRAIDARDGMSLASYDRLFPAQDFLPTHSKGGARFGNLIALPLHGVSRTAGTTLFCDPATWTPYEDQFAYLSLTERLTPGQVQELVETLGPLQAGPSPTTPVLPARPRRSALGKAPKTVRAKAGAMLRISTTGLPPQLIAALKHAANFDASTADILTQRVNKAPVVTTLSSSSAGSSAFGHAVTFTDTVCPGAASTSPTAPPSGTVTVKDGTTVLGTPTLTPGGGPNCSQVQVTTSNLHPGSHAITADYGGDGNYLAADTETLTQTIACTRTITGQVNGSVFATRESTCIINATVRGSVHGVAGGALFIDNSTIQGSVQSSNGTLFGVCGSTVAGTVQVDRATGFVVIGDPGDEHCPGNKTDSVQLTNNHSGVEVVANDIDGSVQVIGTTSTGPFPADGRAAIVGNTIHGSLFCASNVPPPTNRSTPNTVTGSRGGQCTTL